MTVHSVKHSVKKTKRFFFAHGDVVDCHDGIDRLWQPPDITTQLCQNHTHPNHGVSRHEHNTHHQNHRQPL